MAVMKAALLEPLAEARLEIDPRALAVGGGIAGLAAARALSVQGYPTTIVERTPQLGGQTRHLYATANGEDVQQELAALIAATGVPTAPPIWPV